MVGWLAETTRPHGSAISETQFHLFILNASRRLFSDRFFTSSYPPGVLHDLRVDWVNNNGPGGKRMEQGEPNGHDAGGRSAQAHTAANAPGARARAQARDQYVRSVGARSRRILLPGVGSASRRKERSVI